MDREVSVLIGADSPWDALALALELAVGSRRLDSVRLESAKTKSGITMGAKVDDGATELW
jgi:hypothetical protein